jgi:hypothetical protein
MSGRVDYIAPRKMKEKYEAITGITDEFCHEHLNEEYADLSRKMAAVLSKKRPSPPLDPIRIWLCWKAVSRHIARREALSHGRLCVPSEERFPALGQPYGLQCLG